MASDTIQVRDEENQKDAQMKETPILFSGPMVSAILEDRKDQTRRALTTPRSWIKFYDGNKAAATKAFHSDASIWNAGDLRADDSYGRSHWQDGDEQLPQNYQVGDMLWVRENFQFCDKCSTLNFAATVNKPKNCSGCDEYLGKWKPSIHMPRAASRITLELTDVRVERLQETTEEDAKAEGAELTQTVRGLKTWAASYRAAYRSLWDSINARRDGGQFAWDKNPRVFALTFKKL